jgi:hypothetical protein
MICECEMVAAMRVMRCKLKLCPCKITHGKIEMPNRGAASRRGYRCGSVERTDGILEAVDGQCSWKGPRRLSAEISLFAASLN